MTLSLFPETTKHELTHPQDGSPTGLVLDILPADHDDVYQAGIEVVKSLRSKGALEAIDVAVSLENRIKVAAACIVGWTISSDQTKDEAGNTKADYWNVTFKRLGFEDALFSTEKAVALLSMKTAGWVRQQIEAVLSEKERFFKQASNG